MTPSMTSQCEFNFFLHLSLRQIVGFTGEDIIYDIVMQYVFLSFVVYSVLNIYFNIAP